MTGSTPPQTARSRPGQRLESWKEIAAYLKRGVRTVRRWEAVEGLPVHRHVHASRATVYAHPPEIDAWWEGRRHGSHRPVPPVGHPLGGSADRVMVAVLPFANLSGDAPHECFGDGLTEEVITELGRLHPDALGVIARTTVMHYKTARRTVRQIGEELRVRFVLDGSARFEGDRVCVTTQLVRAEDQAQVWAARYERPVRSILALQQEIASEIGREVRVTLTPAQQARRGTARDIEPEAYLAYLRGRHFLNEFTSDAVRRAVECFKAALDIDPTYAQAHASLSEAYAHLGVWTDMPTATTLPLAIGAAHAALGLDPGLAEAYAALGLIHANHVWDWHGAERYFLRALQLNPSLAAAAQWYAEFLAELGRIEEALAIVDLAARHDPLSRSIPASRAFVFWLGRRFHEAIAEAERVLAIDPDYPMALIRLGVAQAGTGAYDKAADAFLAAREATPGLIDCTSLLGYAYACSGRTADAQAQLEALRGHAGERYVPPFLFANVHLGLGEHETALECIERECDARGWYMLLIKQSPLYDPLRAHPRFEALLGRLNL